MATSSPLLAKVCCYWIKLQTLVEVVVYVAAVVFFAIRNSLLVGGLQGFGSSSRPSGQTFAWLLLLS